MLGCVWHHSLCPSSQKAMPTPCPADSVLFLIKIQLQGLFDFFILLKIRPQNAKTYANAKHNNKKLTTLLHILKERLGLGPICVLNEVLIEFLFPLNQQASVNTSLGRWKALKRHLIRLAVIQIIGGKLLNGQFLPGNMKAIQIRGNAGLKEVGLTQLVKSWRPSSPKTCEHFFFLFFLAAGCLWLPLHPAHQGCNLQSQTGRGRSWTAWEQGRCTLPAWAGWGLECSWQLAAVKITPGDCR